MAFAEQFNRSCEDAGIIDAHPPRIAPFRPYINGKMMEVPEAQYYAQVGQLLATCAWIMGKYISFQTVNNDAVTVFDAMKMLLPAEVRYFGVDVC